MFTQAQSTPFSTSAATPKTGRTDRPGTPPVEWKLSARLDWALSLPVSPPTRFVAVAIIKHTNAVSGLAFPSVSTLAKLTGYSKTTVKTAIRELEQGGHFDITRLKVGRVNAANRYRAKRGGVGQEPPHPGAGADPEPVKEPVKHVQDVQQRTVGKPTDPPNAAEKGRSRLRSPHSAQQRMICAIATKLALPGLLTAAGLEDFDELENTKKQALIKRLLKAEARHDRRVAQTRPGRLLREYAARCRSDPPARPDTPPLPPETVARLEADAVSNGYHRAAGQWRKF